MLLDILLYVSIVAYIAGLCAFGVALYQQSHDEERRLTVMSVFALIFWPITLIVYLVLRLFGRIA